MSFYVCPHILLDIDLSMVEIAQFSEAVVSVAERFRGNRTNSVPSKVFQALQSSYPSEGKCCFLVSVRRKCVFNDFNSNDVNELSLM